MYKMVLISLSSLFAISACGSNDGAGDNASNLVQPGQSIQVDQTQLSYSHSQPAQTAFIDPTTGELTSQPRADQIKQLAATNRAQLQYQEPLVEERMSDGSFKIDLPKRLHAQLTVTTDDLDQTARQYQSPVPVHKETSQ